MALITFLSFSGAPGATTTAVAATAIWPRPALLIEADTSKASSVLPGYFAGQRDHSRGITQLSISEQRGQLTPPVIMGQALEIVPDRLVVPGFTSPAVGLGTASLWGPLTTALASLEAAGVDVLVDLGRITPADPRMPLVYGADSVIALLAPTLPDVHAAAVRVDDILKNLAAAGHENYLSLLLVETSQPGYSAREIQRALGTPVIGSLPYAPQASAVYTYGTTEPAKFERSSYIRSVTATTAAITDQITTRRSRLGIRPAPSEEVSA